MSEAESITDKAKRVRQQHEEGEGEQPLITCGCGSRTAMRWLYRCYYCGEWFCHSCAGVHFELIKHPREHCRVHILQTRKLQIASMIEEVCQSMRCEQDTPSGQVDYLELMKPLATLAEVLKFEVGFDTPEGCSKLVELQNRLALLADHFRLWNREYARFPDAVALEMRKAIEQSLSLTQRMIDITTTPGARV